MTSRKLATRWLPALVLLLVACSARQPTGDGGATDAVTADRADTGARPDAPAGKDAPTADRGEPEDLGDAGSDAATDIPADTGPPPGTLGAACTADIECNGSESICYYEDAYLIRGGYCSSFCDPERAGSCGADGAA
jgi:hypothetical protein